VGNISQMQRFKVGGGAGWQQLCDDRLQHRTTAVKIFIGQHLQLCFCLNFLQAIMHSIELETLHMHCLQISEIAGVKLDKDVTVVAMADGSSIPLPPGSGMIDKDGKVGALLLGLGFAAKPCFRPSVHVLCARVYCCLLCHTIDKDGKVSGDDAVMLSGLLLITGQASFACAVHMALWSCVFHTVRQQA
jgi:hypothetical protein